MALDRILLWLRRNPKGSKMLGSVVLGTVPLLSLRGGHQAWLGAFGILFSWGGFLGGGCGAAPCPVLPPSEDAVPLSGTHESQAQGGRGHRGGAPGETSRDIVWRPGRS